LTPSIKKLPSAAKGEKAYHGREAPGEETIRLKGGQGDCEEKVMKASGSATFHGGIERKGGWRKEKKGR